MTTETAPQQTEQTRRETLRKLRHALRRTEDPEAVTKLKHTFHDAERPGFRRVAMSARLMKLRMSLEDLNRVSEPKKTCAVPAVAAPVPEPEPAQEPAPKKVHKSKFAELKLGDAALLLAMDAVDSAPPEDVLPDPVQAPTRAEDASPDLPASAEGADMSAHVQPATAVPLTGQQSGHIPDGMVAEAEPEPSHTPETPLAAKAPIADAEQPGQANGGTGRTGLPLPTSTVAGRAAALRTGRNAPDAGAQAPDWSDAAARVDDPAARPADETSSALDDGTLGVPRGDTGPRPASTPAPAGGASDMRVATRTSTARPISPLDGLAPENGSDRAGSATGAGTKDQTAALAGPVVNAQVPQRAATTSEAQGTSAKRTAGADTTRPTVQPDPVSAPRATAAIRPPAVTDSPEQSRAAKADHLRGDLPASAQIPADEARAADKPAAPFVEPAQKARQAAPTAAHEEEPTAIAAMATADPDDLETKVFRKPKKGTPMVNLDAMAALAAFTAASPKGLAGSADDTGDDWLWNE